MNRFESHRLYRAHCKSQRRNKCEICSHEFCTPPELLAHQNQGCEGLIDIDSTDIDRKPNVFDWNLEFNSEFNENQAIDDEGDYANADEQHAQSDYQKYTDSSVSISFNQTQKATETIKLEQSNKHPECEFCGRSFSFKSNLRFHQRHVHGFKRQYSCDYCDKTFEYRKQLIVHRTTHSGIQQCLFECWLCHES